MRKALADGRRVCAWCWNWSRRPWPRKSPRRISIPTIGIGSGPDCDGQILVTHDLIGTFPWFTPRFVKPRANCAAEIKSAVAAWKNSLH